MKALIASAALILLPSLASAQKSDDESLAAAGKLVEAMGMKEQLKNGFEAAMRPRLQPMIQQMGLNAGQVAELNSIFSSWWNDDVDQDLIITRIQILWTESFTVEELKELELFYRSDLGKKMLLTLPTLTQKGMEIGLSIAESEQQTLQKKMEAFAQSLAESRPAPSEEKKPEPATKP